MRRSTKREQVVVMLSSLGGSTRRAPAQACGVSTSRLAEILYGGTPSYSKERAPITLGLVDDITTDSGRSILRITERGRRKARQLTSRKVRRAAARRVARELRDGVAAAALPRRPPLPTARTGVSTAVFSWSYVREHTGG